MSAFGAKRPTLPLHLVVHTVRQFGELVEVHRLMESSPHIGKNALKPG